MSHPILARRVILWASLVGLFASTYLLITYVSGAPIVCGPAAGCDIVRASKWAYSFGLPRPLLGVAFYGAMIAVLAFRILYPHRFSRRIYHLSMVLAAIGFVESAFLTFVQWLDIKAFCIWCLTSAAAATVIFIAAWFDRSYALDHAESLRELKILFWSFVVAVVMGGLLIALFIAPKTDGDLPRIEASAGS